jgi:hypothetical protein
MNVRAGNHDTTFTAKVAEEKDEVAEDKAETPRPESAGEN